MEGWVGAEGGAGGGGGGDGGIGHGPLPPVNVQHVLTRSTHLFSCCLGCRPGLEHRARCFTRLTPNCPGRGIGGARSDPRNEVERDAEFQST